MLQLFGLRIYVNYMLHTIIEKYSKYVLPTYLHALNFVPKNQPNNHLSSLFSSRTTFLIIVPCM